MDYAIRRRDGPHEMWLTSQSPALKWGPPQNAKRYRTQGLARRALALLSAAQRRTSEIVPIEPLSDSV